jgi:hypothetical protein
VEAGQVNPTELNLLATAFTNVDKCSLHTDDPGNTGDNDSGITHGTVTWSTPAAGYMYAVCEFASVTGTFTHVGLWDDTVFISGHVYDVQIPTAQTLKVLIEFQARVKV